MHKSDCLQFIIFSLATYYKLVLIYEDSIIFQHVFTI